MRDIDEVEFVVGPHARLKIARIAPGALKYLATIRVDMFSLEDLLDRFGGGDYYIRVFDGSRYVQAFRVALDCRVPPRNP